MLLDHDFGWDDGLICGGSVSGLILPRAVEAAELWRKLATITEPVTWGVKRDFSIAQITNSKPKRPLAPSLSPVGREGGVSPGEGDDWLYAETVAPPTELWIAGSGHVAQAVVPLALQLNFAATVFDDRPGLANHNFFPPETQLRVGGWHELLKEPLPKSPVFGLIVTRGHQHDALVLTEWIQRPFVFLGMIGSRRKARIIREQFLKQNITSAEQFDRIACPVGMDIQAQTTAEIAVSVLAQYIQKRAELNKF
jgi:xanthine dehydrogenase accessory factor